MILKVLQYPSEILRVPGKDVSFPLSSKNKKLIKDMLETVRDHQGIGLAAPQVGASERIIIVNLEHLDMPPFALINPEIVKSSKQQTEMEEGCLSIKGVFGMVKRPEAITFRGKDLRGKVITAETDGLLSKVIQHETDHTNGILIIDKIKNYTQGQEILDQMEAQKENKDERQEMKFARDILLIDIEATSQDIEKGFPLQLSAILLDKDNLLEKNFFNSYIKHPFSQTTNDQIVQTLGIPKEKWITAPNLKTVIQNFKASFPYNVTLCSHNIININFLRESFKRTKVDYEYDYHILDLWTLGYFLMSKQNLKKIPTAETLGSYFKLVKAKDHDSLENVRYLADILRKISKT